MKEYLLTTFIVSLRNFLRLFGIEIFKNYKADKEIIKNLMIFDFLMVLFMLMAMIFSDRISDTSCLFIILASILHAFFLQLEFKPK